MPQEYSAVAELTATVIFNVLATAAVGLRFWSKKMSKTSIVKYAEDWLLLLAMFIFYSYSALAYYMIVVFHGGADAFEAKFSFSALTTFLKMNMATLVLMFSGETACKLSILFFLRRVFSAPQSRRLCLAMIVLATAWWVAALMTALLSCLPFNKFWKPDEPGFCINFDIFFLWIEIACIAIDSAIVLLPAYFVSRLHMSKTKKIQLSLIFLLGTFTVVTLCLRTAFVYVPDSQYVSFTGSLVWSPIHLGVGVICACLPFFRLLATKASESITGLSYLLRRGRTTAKDSSYVKGGSPAGSGNGKTGAGHWTQIIEVTQTVDVESTTNTSMDSQKRDIEMEDLKQPDGTHF